MSLLSLDLGRHVGYALWDVDLKKPLSPGWLYNLEQNGISLIESGCWDFTNLELADCYAKFYYEAGDLCASHPFSMIAYECIEFMKYRYTAQVQFGLEAIVLLFSVEFKVTVVPQGVTKMKKFICGHGRAQKRDIVTRVMHLLKENRIRKDSITDHEADAIACGLLTIQELKAEHEP